MTPEEFFLGEDPRSFIRTFDPTAHVSPVSTSKTDASRFFELSTNLVSMLTSRRLDSLYQKERSRAGDLLRKSRRRQVDVVPTASEATRLRTCQPGHTQECMLYTFLRSVLTSN
jgi:hypothetical protein